MEEAIILTTCIRRETDEKTEQLKQLYKSNIQKWLESYDNDIYVIETSGEGFDIEDERLHQCVCDLNSDTTHPFSTTTSEAHSILLCLEKFDMSKYKYIYKVTGRYFLDNLEKPKESSLYYFQEPINGHNHCEVMCFDVRVLQTFMESVLYKCKTQYWKSC